METKSRWALSGCLMTLAALLVVSPAHGAGVDGGYVGTDKCLDCHKGSPASDKRSFLQAGHPWKYRHTGGATPGPLTTPWDPISGLFPTPLLTGLSTSTLNPLRVDNGSGRLDWSAINYAIGGYGWKIRWGIRDFGQATGGVNPPGDDSGYVWAGGAAQYNLEDGSWSAYSNATNKKYECAVCHNTNGIVSTAGYSCITDGGTNAAPARTEPWASNPGMGPEAATRGGYFSSWSLNGVQCEACHGKGSNPGNAGHADLGAAVTQGTLALAGGVEICAKCHIRSGNVTGTNDECGGDSNALILTSGARISGDFIQHHEQYNEMVGLNGDGVHAALKCTTCHDPHKRAITLTTAVATALGVTDNGKSALQRGAIVKTCESCHAGKALTGPMAGVTCVDCHMAEATKTAINSPTTGWGRKGDLKTHIFKIDPLMGPGAAAMSRTNSDGKTVARNAVSVAYACGKCHDNTLAADFSGLDLTFAKAQAFATKIHDTALGYPVTFAYTIDPANALKVNVTALVTCPGTCPAFTYEWNWGEGPVGSGSPTNKTYADGGKKTIALTVRVDDGSGKGKKVGVASRSVNLTNPDLPPTANATCTWNANTWTMTVLDTSTDDGSDADTAPDASPLLLNVIVDWGDGARTFKGAGATFAHTYRKAGTFAVTQKVIDRKLQLDTKVCATAATPAYFTISGKVFKTDGVTGVASAVVQVKKGATVVKTVYTNSTGAYAAGSVPAGTYALVASKLGYTFPALAGVEVGPSQTGKNLVAN